MEKQKIKNHSPQENAMSCVKGEIPTPVDTDIPLIRSYNEFSHKCVAEGMHNIKEIAELFRVREELRLA